MELVSLSLLCTLVKDPEERVVPVSREWLRAKQEREPTVDDESVVDEEEKEEEQENQKLISLRKKYAEARRADLSPREPRKKSAAASAPPKVLPKERAVPKEKDVTTNKKRPVREKKEKKMAAVEKPARKKAVLGKKTGEVTRVLHRAFCSARETLIIEEVRKCESGGRRLELLEEHAELFSKRRLRELCREWNVEARGTLEEMRKLIAWAGLDKNGGDGVVALLLPDGRTMDSWADMDISQIKAEMKALERRKDAAESGK